MTTFILANVITDFLTSGMGIAAVVLFLLFGTAIGYASRYKRCPSNKILVIYGQVGGTKASKTVHGGGTFVWPIVQDYAYLGLEPIQIEVPLQDALSSENIRVNVPSVFTVAIGTQPEVMQNAAIRLLGLNTSQVKKQAEDIIFGQLRQVIASMQIEDINRDRELFLNQIQNSLEPELKKIGLVLINVNITDITDESGYIEAIGRKAASEAVQKARGDVADQEKLGEIRVAQAEREKMVEVANAMKLQNIGVREADREQAVKIAELEKEQEVGERAAQFRREASVAEAEQSKRIAVAEAEAMAVKGEADAAQAQRISVADANATAISGEAEAAAKVAHAKAELQVQEAEAFAIGETKKRVAAAAVEEAQNLAMAKAALADAQRVEAERRAELEAPAKAEKAKLIVEAEAEAARMKLEAEGEASAIFAKLEAQAKGEYEVLAAKGEGLKTIIEACGGADQAFRMMMLEHMDELAKTSAEAISKIKFDKIVVWEGGNGSNGNGSSTSNFLQNLSRSMPPMMHVMKDIAGIEVPEYLAKLTGDEDIAKAIASAGAGASASGVNPAAKRTLPPSTKSVKQVKPPVKNEGANPVAKTTPEPKKPDSNGNA